MLQNGLKIHINSNKRNHYLGAYKKWSIKTDEIQEQCNCKITVSTLLEYEATDTDRSNSLDIADYMIEELKALSILIKKLHLEEF